VGAAGHRGATATVDFAIGADEDCVDPLLSVRVRGMDYSNTNEYTTVSVNGTELAQCRDGAQCGSNWHECFAFRNLVAVGVVPAGGVPANGSLRVELVNTIGVDVCTNQFDVELSLYCPRLCCSSPPALKIALQNVSCKRLLHLSAVFFKMYQQ